MTPEERAKAVAEHFGTLPVEVRAELERIVASAIKRALVEQLRSMEAVVRPNDNKPCVTERDYVKFAVYEEWLMQLLGGIGTYGDPATLRAASVLTKASGTTTP